MKPVLSLFLRRSVWRIFVAAILIARSADAQVPIPIQEQVNVFKNLPPAQQESLIRELQRELPPAQREAIVNMLQGREGAPPPENLDRDTTNALEQKLNDAEAAKAEKPEEQRFKPRDTLVLELTVRPEVLVNGAPPDEVRDFRERLAKANPHELDSAGQLLLPGVRAISLAGLNVDQATVRVQAEPALKDFTAIITRLPLVPVGTAALKPFGYDLFDRSRTRFASPTEIPIPVGYVLGPGDTVNVQLFGNQNNEYFFTVSRDGTINFPELGPVVVSGLTFEDLRNMINQRVSEQMIGVRASVTLGETRSIQVYVVGDVVRPGSYSVKGLSTMTSALFESGGVKPIGSLRNISLMRDGNTISRLDLYDLLLRGDTRADARLQPGDVILVPPVGPTATVDGEVRRPAIYEIKGERGVADVLSLAGGLTAEANRSAVKLERVVPNRGTTAEDIDMATDRAQTPVRDGDVLRVQPNLDQLQNSIRLSGNVFQPGLYNWFPGMRIADLLPASELVKPMSDLGYVLIRREAAPNVDVQVLSADLRDAWLHKAGRGNVPLEPRDTVYVFNVETGRTPIVDTLLQELKAQAAPHTPQPIVRIGGQVRATGDYPLEREMRISDLLRAGGGLSDAAYVTDAELTRYAVVNGEYRETELVTVNLAGVLKGDSTADIVLSPYDYLNVKEVARWRGEESITLQGEVVFPGTYPIRRGEKLSSVLARAGGLTDLAFPEGSVFTRVEAREREKEQLEVLARRIERELATISVSEPNASQTINTGQALISQLRNAQATGRLVIRLDELVAGETDNDVILKDGDRLIIPDQRQEVTVLGEVQYGTSHVFERGVTRDEYLARSGGPTERADTKRIYVVRANGEVVLDKGGRWFSRDAGSQMRPGDSIVVPLKVDQPIARWSAITQIIYNLAIAAAAVSSF